MEILFLNGPNLDLLGTREPQIYGTSSLADIEFKVSTYADALKSAGRLHNAAQVTWIQTNSESEFLDWITKKNWFGIIVNPGAWSHYNFAVSDRLMAVRNTVILVEVHLSNIHAREEFRQKTVTGKACHGIISGLGSEVYTLALEFLAMKSVQTNA